MWHDIPHCCRSPVSFLFRLQHPTERRAKAESEGLASLNSARHCGVQPQWRSASVSIRVECCVEAELKRLRREDEAQVLRIQLVQEKVATFSLPAGSAGPTGDRACEPQPVVSRD